MGGVAKVWSLGQGTRDSQAQARDVRLVLVSCVFFSGIGYFKKLSYQSATGIRSKTIFWLVYGRCITGLETGIKLVAGWYYLEYLPDW